jgi:hypothetical protein
MFKHNTVACQRTLLFILSLIAYFLPAQLSVAQTNSVPVPSDAPLELSLLANPQGSVKTADTINQSRLTNPSLWWVKENSENKLLDNWIAYQPTDKVPGRIDIIVNQQIWSLLDYLERYDFVNSVGTVARNSRVSNSSKYGYNVRFFNYQKERLASYTCNFDVTPTVCNIRMNLNNRLALPRSL